MSLPTHTNIESLQDWFFSNTKPFWVVYSNKITNKSKGIVLRRNVENIDMEDSWELLQNTLLSQSQPGSKFTIFSAKAAPGEAGCTQGTTAYYEVAKNSVGGIHGHVPNIYGVPFQEYMSNQIDTRMKIYDQEREISDLKAELKAGQNISLAHEVFGFVREDPQGCAVILQSGLGFIQGLMSMVIPKTSVSVAGIPPQENTQTDDINTEIEYDTERIITAMERIRQALNIDPVTALEKLAAYAEKKPEVILPILNSVLK